MKSQIMVAVLGIAAMFPFASTANAISGDQSNITADITFDFTVGNTHFQAGKYRLVVADRLLTVRTLDGTRAATVHTVRHTAKDSAGDALRFENKNGELALSEVRWNGTKEGVQILDVAPKNAQSPYIARGK